MGGLLKEMGYSLQGNRKTLEGTSHPDRNAQFEYINKKAEAALIAGQPVISVDTKKKSWSVNTRTLARNGGQKASQKKSKYTILWMRRWGAPILMVSMI